MILKIMIEYKKIKNKILRDREIKKEYDKLDFEFALIKKIIEERIKKGVTQKELAEIMGTKQSAISRLESGSYNPTLSFINKISKALDFELKIN